MEELKKVDADILVLTETSSKINLNSTYQYSWETENLISEGLFPKVFYKSHENRVSIWSKFPGIRRVETFNSYTSVCQEIQTPLGNLIVYGTIIGIEGNRNKSFLSDLKLHLNDFDKFSANNNFCIIGDLNLTFSDNDYFTVIGRNMLWEAFAKNDLHNLTSEIPKNIDHIVISKNLLSNGYHKPQIWNWEKIFSDHIGVTVTIIHQALSASPVSICY